MEKTVNYTQEQVAEMVAAYRAGTSIEDLAKNLGKSTRSVVAKLSREGVYESKAKAKVAAGRVTKEQMVALLADRMGEDVEALKSLAKAEKVALELVTKFVVAVPVAEAA